MFLLVAMILPTLSCAPGDEPRPHSEASRSGPQGSEFQRESPFVIRPFRPFSGSRWIGEAIAYGPHRDGQRPGGPAPSRAELREDLRLMSKHWKLLRVYGSAGPAESLLAIIREDGIDMKVVLGFWIAPEDRRDSTGKVLELFPKAKTENRREIDTATRLAAEYPEIVAALCAGNETQIFWSAHKVPTSLLVRSIREARARTVVPVTTGDDFNFWNKPESRAVASEVDFIFMHAHPLWNGHQVEDAVTWTRAMFEQVRAMHPGRTTVIGETGWATRRLDHGEQGKLMKGKAGEAEQAVVCDAFRKWARADSITLFLFEAFDENWKGGQDPNEVEKHWGLFRADRTPKPAALSQH